MITNANVTLFNQIPGVDGPTWYRTQLMGVNWQEKRSASISDKGLITADSVIIFIPESVAIIGEIKTYLPPKQFLRSDVKEHFTFTKGDIIVKGLVDVELSGEGSISVKDLHESYDDAVTIIGVSPPVNGSAFIRHFELEAE